MAPRRPIPKTSLMQTGYVKQVEDKKKAGRIRVWIPEFDTLEDDESGWIVCNYCSPFAGATNWRDNSSTEFDTFETTQTSYGFWAVPPDVNNEVLIVFPNNDVSRALWVGCVFKEFMNHMIPGHAASDKNKNAPGKKVPVAEYNKFDVKSGDSATPLDPVRPWHKTHTEGIGNQGLITDEVRGTTTSSAQRDEVSAVYGMNTPGPLHDTIKGSRLGGHSFILDDSPDSEYIGLRTRSGAQFRIDETNGLVYAINKTGTSWMQMDADGNFDIFAAKSVSVRSQENINFRADKDINIEAGQNIYMKAAKDTDAELAIVGEDAGEGGNIYFQALNDMHTTVKMNKFVTVTDGNINVDIQTGNLTEHVAGNVDVTVDGNVTNNVTGTLNYKVTDAITVDTASTISIKSSNFNVDTSGNTHAIGNIISDINMQAVTINLSANVVAVGSGTFATLAAAGIASGGDVTSSSASLNDTAGHTHAYSWTDPGGSGVTGGHVTAGGTVTAPAFDSTSATGPAAATSATVTPALIKEPLSAVNILSTFPTTSVTTNGGKNIEVPDWWNRDTQDVSTIVERFATFEPCPIHITSSDT